MIDKNKENLTAQGEGTIPIKVYGCSANGANILNIYGCVGCQSLSQKPVETLQVPKSVIAEGKEIQYLDRNAKSGRFLQKLTCEAKALRPEL